jgi:hypothetical protein
MYLFKLQNEINFLKKEFNILQKFFKTPYVTIKKFENIHYDGINDWNLTINTLFFENLIPQMWIINKLKYVPANKKQIIVYIYLISHTVKKCIVNKLIKYCSYNFHNVSIK